MNDLVTELKSRLKVEEVIASTYKLRREGRHFVAVEHDSLKVLPERGCWKWWSQSGAGGDVLSWIAYQKFGRTQVWGEQFADVLREGCRLAGIEFEAFARTDPQAAERARARREREEILEAYVALAEACRTKETGTRMRQAKPFGIGKAWLSDEVLERWRIGQAPTLEQCLKAGLDPAGLRRVGLLRESTRGPQPESYLHFRDSIVIPWIDFGRVVYLTSRRLRDFDGRGEPLDKQRKALSLPSPQGPDEGGIERPAGFNLNALGSAEAKSLGVWIVEGPLDAIALSEQGRPAVAMGSASPHADLVRRMANYRDIRLFLALDSDIGLAQRCRVMARLGANVYDADLAGVAE